MEIILTGILAFASTNIDDIFVLILFFGDKRHKTSNIYIGQYLGIIALIAISVIGSEKGNFIEGKYVGLLGLFPIYLGLKGTLNLVKGKNEDIELKQEKQKIGTTGFLSVGTVTFANGGDNIGTYIPLFTAITPSEKLIMISVFLIMVIVWLTTAKYLTTYPTLARVISKYGHIITPLVLILLGLYILKENGSFELLF